MYARAAEQILSAKRCVAFTGAGISVESGIPPFRGERGVWNKYDPESFEINYFKRYPRESWEVIRRIFYELFGRVLPNTAHYTLAEMEARQLIQAVITQNVDHLHQDAGNKVVHEFHGSLKNLICLSCGYGCPVSQVDLDALPPLCSKCGGILKPDMVFFGEPIPEPASSLSFEAARGADCLLLVGTTGSVAPANMIPSAAKSRGATIIEINPEPSEYTRQITDIHIRETAGRAMESLMEAVDALESGT